MTLHDIELFSKYARKHPPLRVLVQGCAAALGVQFKEPEEKKPQRYMNFEQAKAWAAAANRAMVNPNG